MPSDDVLSQIPKTGMYRRTKLSNDKVVGVIVDIHF